MRGILILITGMLMLVGCHTTRYVTVEKVRTDTTYITKQQRDSVYLERHDSIVTYRDGDTVLIERWHYRDRWRDRVKIDTIYKSKTDTMYVEKVIEKTEKQSWWKTLKMKAGLIFLYLVIGFVLAFVVSRKIRRL